MKSLQWELHITCFSGRLMKGQSLPGYICAPFVRDCFCSGGVRAVSPAAFLFSLTTFLSSSSRLLTFIIGDLLSLFLLTGSQPPRVKRYGVQFLDWTLVIRLVGAIDFAPAGADYRLIRRGLERTNFIGCSHRLVGQAHGICYFFIVCFHKGIFRELNVLSRAGGFSE